MPLTRAQVYTRCERTVTSLREQYPEALVSFSHDFNMNMYRFQMILGMQAYHHAVTEEILSEEGVDCFSEMIDGCRNFYRQNTTSYAPIGAIQHMRPGDIVFNRDGVPVGAVESIEMNHDSYSMEYMMELRVTNRSTRFDMYERDVVDRMTALRDRERESLMTLMTASAPLVIPEDMRPPETVDIIGPSGTFDFATETGTVDRVVLEDGAEISRRMIEAGGNVSIGGSVRSATCSICGAIVNDSEGCGHDPGSYYLRDENDPLSLELCTRLINGVTLHSVGIDSLGDNNSRTRIEIGDMTPVPLIAESTPDVAVEETLPEVFCARFSIADFFMEEAGTL